MVGFNVLTFEEAIQAVDHSMLVLLFGMMIVVANLRLPGFFRIVAARAIKHAHRPKTLLAAIVNVAGVLSAFFVNDTMCLVLTPLVLEVAARLVRNPRNMMICASHHSMAGGNRKTAGLPLIEQAGISLHPRVPHQSPERPRKGVGGSRTSVGVPRVF